MAKRIMQFRFYADNNSKNQPIVEDNDLRTISKSTLHNGEVFKEYPNILQLGIQTLPGTKFYLNDGINPIIVGSTGIYEVDLEGVSPITKIAFNQESLDIIENTANAYLIVDMIYDTEF